MGKIEVTKTELVWPGRWTEAGVRFDGVAARTFDMDLRPEGRLDKRSARIGTSGPVAPWRGDDNEELGGSDG
jgi:hypothetical protein